MPATKPKSKRPPGRPPTLAGGGRVYVYLDARTVELAQRLGDGSISAGIRKAFKLLAEGQ